MKGNKLIMNNNDFTIYNICLTFEQLKCVTLFNKDEALDYESEIIPNFRFKSTETLDSEGLSLWCNQKIN